MDDPQTDRGVNLTPSPRVLRMLGQIDFKPWQCLAELIDNSVDAFLTAGADERQSLFPQVNVELSSAAEIRKKSGLLRIVDNGPGMDPEHLENALRAGFSGNDPVGKLGLFGMGFNVATARLGHRTEVWTTRREDEHWTGVRIDFDEMEKSGSFLVPRLTRVKGPSSVASGTEIVISKLDVDRAIYLRSGGGMKSTRQKLSRVYNKIMRDIGLQVIVADTALLSREFCRWGDSRAVETKSDFGRVPAYIPINQDLGDRLYCQDCWSWLLEEETVCPVCESADRLRKRTRRVTGWLGIQRYFHQDDYGIDLIRNGRVIEERSKSFFSFEDPDTGEIWPEYPLEQTHWGGRIVGELSVDFVPLASHQKDSFDRSTPEWRLVERAIRGEGPIIQIRRQRLGLLDKNLSPLARLHAGYRRGQPAGLRTLVPGDAQGRGINKEPTDWAAEFWSGTPEYQTDERWWKAVLTAEEARNRKQGAAISSDLAGEAELDDQPADEQKDEEGDRPEASTGQVLQDEDDIVLSGTYEVPDIPGAPKLEVEVRRLRNGSLPNGLHFQFVALGSRAEATYNPDHRLFARSPLEPTDCLIEELAYQFLARSATSQREWPLSRITWEIRKRYFPWSLGDFETVAQRAEALIGEFTEHYVERLGELAPIDRDVLDERLRDELTRRVALIDRAGEDRVEEVVRTGEFPRYLGPNCVEFLVRRWPELALDGEFLSLSYSDVDPRYRPEVIERVLAPMRDLLWAVQTEGVKAGGEEWRTLVGRASNALRLLEGWRS